MTDSRSFFIGLFRRYYFFLGSVSYVSRNVSISSRLSSMLMYIASPHFVIRLTGKKWFPARATVCDICTLFSCLFSFSLGTFISSHIQKCAY